MPDGLTPDQRSMRARIAAHSQHAQGQTSTGKARAAFNDRFERQVDPDGALPADERARRAEHAKRAYFQKLALKSAKARRKAAQATAEADAADAELAEGGDAA